MLLFTKPIPRPAIWGGTRLQEYFNCPDFPGQIGQSWRFSAQEGDGESNRILNGPMTGKTLSEVWREHPELFQSRWKRFPVLVSLVAPVENLSVQIHPDDAIAAEEGFPTGKNEAWYFLETSPSSHIVYGQSARDEPALRELIAAERWSEIVCYLPVSMGDFVYLPAGTVHALTKGNIVYEIQQATDVTYRLYDYHRKDARGRERDLQVEQAIRRIHYGLPQDAAHPAQTTHRSETLDVTVFLHNDSFCVRRYDMHGAGSIRFVHYALLTCVNGEGTINGVPFRRGLNCLVPVHTEVSFSGEMTVLSTSED